MTRSPHDVSIQDTRITCRCGFAVHALVWGRETALRIAHGHITAPERGIEELATFVGTVQ